MRERAEQTPHQRADHLKERIYVAFTALAVVLALRSHVTEETAGSAALTLVVTVLGTLLAVLTADFISHLAAHAVMPTRDELAHMVSTSLGAFVTIVLPLLLVGLAAIGVWTLEEALRACTVVLLATLGLVGYLAVRRTRVSPLTKLVVLLAEVAVGALVVALEVLAHG